MLQLGSALEAGMRRFNFIDRTKASCRSHRRGMEEKWKMLVHILIAELSGLIIGCWVHWKEMNQGLHPPFLCFLYSTYHNYFLDLFFY